MALRTSSEPSSTMRAVDLSLPVFRASRNRRTMFSMSMMASSTTTPTAITRPARIMVLIVCPRRCSTSNAAISDIGMATTLISALRHEKRNISRIRTTSAQPRSRASVRLWIARSMKSADRKMVGSIVMPVRPGFISFSAASTLWVTSSVLPHGSFMTTSIRPRSSLMTASPKSG